jgi:hypothetical protein
VKFSHPIEYQEFSMILFYEFESWRDVDIFGKYGSQYRHHLREICPSRRDIESFEDAPSEIGWSKYPSTMKSLEIAHDSGLSRTIFATDDEDLRHLGKIVVIEVRRESTLGRLYKSEIAWDHAICQSSEGSGFF